MNLQTLKDNKNDYIVIVARFGNIETISKPYTYRKEAVKMFNNLLNLSHYEDRNYKLWVQIIDEPLLKRLEVL